MSRGVRKSAAVKLPEGVRWATAVPVLVIPSAGHSAKGDGADGNLRRQGAGTKRETEVRLRYAPCCDPHKGEIKVASLASTQEIVALCSRLTQHHGHGKLLPGQARIEWAACEDKIACSDCMADAAERERRST